MSDLARILGSIQQGDPKGAEHLLPLVYEQLRKVAAARMAQQPPGQTLQATALVHEAWLRLATGQKQAWENRRHFFAAAAQAMRHILVERARRKLRARHGAGLERVDLDAIEIPSPTRDDRILELNAALDELAALSPEKAEVVKLRFFVGLGEQEIAELLQLSPRTVERYWNHARVWLFERMERARSNGSAL